MHITRALSHGKRPCARSVRGFSSTYLAGCARLGLAPLHAILRALLDFSRLPEK